MGPRCVVEQFSGYLFEILTLPILSNTNLMLVWEGTSTKSIRRFENKIDFHDTFKDFSQIKQVFPSCVNEVVKGEAKKKAIMDHVVSLYHSKQKETKDSENPSPYKVTFNDSKISCSTYAPKSTCQYLLTSDKEHPSFNTKQIEGIHASNSTSFFFSADAFTWIGF